MQIIQKIRCPNCGSEGERHYNSGSQTTRTQCPTCDYLMVTCARTGKVLEAYAPGLSPHSLSLRRRPELSTSSIRLQPTGVTYADSDLLLLQDVDERLDTPRTGPMVGRLSDRIVGN